MASTKEQIADLLREQPDNSSYDELIRELAFYQVIQRGLTDSEAGRTLSNDAMQHRIQTWRMDTLSLK